MNKNRILIVDDEPKMVRLLREIFTATGFEVLVASNGENAVQMVALEQPDLLVLDILLGSPFDGYEVCKRVREYSDVPVVMLTAKVRDADRIQGFDVGADDYITKPFNSRELVARVRALLKRSQGKSFVIEPEIECGDLMIDMARRRVYISGREIHLTPTEYNLLHELAHHPNQVMLHEQLLTAIWGEQYRSDDEYLRAYIYNLRKKIEEDPSHPRRIVRCAGVGYMLVVPSVEEIT